MEECVFGNATLTALHRVSLYRGAGPESTRVSRESQRNLNGFHNAGPRPSTGPSPPRPRDRATRACMCTSTHFHTRALLFQFHTFLSSFSSLSFPVPSQSPHHAALVKRRDPIQPWRGPHQLGRGATKSPRGSSVFPDAASGFWKGQNRAARRHELSALQPAPKHVRFCLPELPERLGVNEVALSLLTTTTTTTTTRAVWTLLDKFFWRSCVPARVRVADTRSFYNSLGRDEPLAFFSSRKRAVKVWEGRPSSSSSLLSPLS